MSDVVVVPEVAPEVVAEPVGKAGDEPKVFDEKYVKQLRDEAAANRVKLKEFEDRDKTDAQKSADRIAELEQENAGFKKEAERSTWITDAATATGLDTSALALIQGNSKEEILENATKLKSFIPEIKTVIPGDAERTALPLNGDGIESALRTALGI